MSEAMRRQFLWSLARHIQERMSKKASGLRSYRKLVK